MQDTFVFLLLWQSHFVHFCCYSIGTSCISVVVAMTLGYRMYRLHLNMGFHKPLLYYISTPNGVSCITDNNRNNQV